MLAALGLGFHHARRLARSAATSQSGKVTKSEFGTRTLLDHDVHAQGVEDRQAIPQADGPPACEPSPHRAAVHAAAILELAKSQAATGDRGKHCCSYRVCHGSGIEQPQ
jgi:hypothetical protein